MIRERAVDLFRLPPALAPDDALDAKLEALNPGRSFSAAADGRDGARDRHPSWSRAAQSLNQWLEEIQR